MVGDLTLAVLRSERRSTVGLTVERDGALTVQAPKDAGTEELTSLVRRREVWIYGKLAEKEMLLRAWRPKEFIRGEGFMYLGRRYRLRFSDDPEAPPLRFSGGWFVIRRDQQPTGGEVFAEWYAERGRKWLPSRTRRFVDRVGVTRGPIKVRDLGYRWGSCGVRRLHFHWRVMSLPARIIDYVIVHELAHMAEPHHKPAFWERVRQPCPTSTSAAPGLRFTGPKPNEPASCSPTPIGLATWPGGDGLRDNRSRPAQTPASVNPR